MSLFELAAAKGTRLKMYIYGDTGTGKTVTSLHFPSPAIIDTERGSEHYGDKFTFQRLDTAEPSRINQALDELLKDPADFKTLIIEFVYTSYSCNQDFYTIHK